MANTDVNVTEGDGKRVAGYAITEDSTTRVIQRIALNTSSGTEIGSGNPLPVSISESVSSEITSVVPGTGSTNLGKAANASYQDSDTGVLSLGVRNDGNTTRSDGDGDYTPVAVDHAGSVRVIGNVEANVGDGGNPIKVGGVYNNTLPTYDTGDRTDFQTDSRGQQRVVVSDVFGNNITAFNLPSADGNTASSTGLSVSAYLAMFNGTTWDRIRGDTTNGLLVNLGSNNDVTVTSGSITTVPATSGGWDTFNATSGDGSTALTNSAQAIKASAGQLGGWYIYNPNASVAYVILYNTASGSVTVGTTNPKMVLAIPAQGAANIEMQQGLAFSTAISVAATSTAGGNGAPASALEAMFWYK